MDGEDEPLMTPGTASKKPRPQPGGELASCPGCPDPRHRRTVLLLLLDVVLVACLLGASIEPVMRAWSLRRPVQPVSMSLPSPLAKGATSVPWSLALTQDANGQLLDADARRDQKKKVPRKRGEKKKEKKEKKEKKKRDRQPDESGGNHEARSRDRSRDVEGVPATSEKKRDHHYGGTGGKHKAQSHDATEVAPAASAGECGTSVREFECAASPTRALVSLSFGHRPHMQAAIVPMRAYAARVGAELHVVDSRSHPSLAAWEEAVGAGSNISTHFLKLPLLQWFLHRFDQVLFVDDDVLFSPFASDMFSMVPCREVGAVIEASHIQNWHTMHARALCELYDLQNAAPAACGKAAVKTQRIFNSGVLLLSKAHLPLLDGWQKRELRCRILCDQLYLNAMLRLHNVCLRDLGVAFNLPGTLMRKILLTSAEPASNSALTASVLPPLRDTPLGAACVVHLTVLPARKEVMSYLLKRAVQQRDVLQCTAAGGGGGGGADASAMLGSLPKVSDKPHDIEKALCGGRPKPCKLRAAESAAPSAKAVAAESEAATAAAAAAELPDAALAIVRRAVKASWDGNTVILLFATSDFMDLALNFMQAATALDVRNFVLVAMDRKLAEILNRFDQPPAVMLPRLASGAVRITKLNVIGERQRFGLRVLERGFNVLFMDLDAIMVRSPAPLLTDGDIIGERIWGRPKSIVSKWGAAICTGFYFVRSNPRTIAIFRQTHARIVAKRRKMPRWQASDQWAINHAIDDQGVAWESGERMQPVSDMHTKFYDNESHVGFTTALRSKFVVLPHKRVARSCPILSKYGLARPPASEPSEVSKWKIWKRLLDDAYVLHCFPPNSMPCPTLKHGEEGCDKSVIMGHATHIKGEVEFDRAQGMWFMRDGWEQTIEEPEHKDFFDWLRSQNNGRVVGEALPGEQGAEPDQVQDSD